MRAGAGEQHRVVALLDQGRVVPATAELVADVVVRGGRDPDRPRRVGPILEVDEDLLPVRLVVVRAVERRAIVVHEVEVEVVEHDPAVAPDDPPVIDQPWIDGLGRLVLHLGGGGRAAWHGATQQQRGVEPRVDEPSEQSHARQPAGARQRGRLGRPCQRASSIPESGCWTSRRYSDRSAVARWCPSVSVVTSPRGTTTTLSRSEVPSSRSHSARYPSTAVGKNSSPSL